MQGYIKWVSPRGFGFIRDLTPGSDRSKDIFFHMQDVVDDWWEPQSQDLVEFDLIESMRKPGSMAAAHVRLAQDEP